MNVTQFKKEIKGITSSKKKLKPIEHEEYILSGTSDAVIHNHVIVVVPSFSKEYEVVTDRNKPIAHIVKSLDVLTDQNILGKVATVYGLNYLFTMDKKQICTFMKHEERYVNENEYNTFKEVDALRIKYFVLKRQYKQQLKQNIINNCIEEITKVRHMYLERIMNFKNTFGYNPTVYHLKLNK